MPPVRTKPAIVHPRRQGVAIIETWDTRPWVSLERLDDPAILGRIIAEIKLRVQYKYPRHSGESKEFAGCSIRPFALGIRIL